MSTVERKHLIHPDTRQLTIRAKYDISMAGTLDLYEVINQLFRLGYGQLSETEIYIVRAHLAKLTLRDGLEGDSSGEGH